jgi:predicted AlkP superfamily phosphohydrolase/phosphomutase/tetratricopeptide (TPR) repeat protein
MSDRHASPSTQGKKLLLIGWDSADWKIIRPLIAKGEMPMLAKLLDCGASGNLATLQPVLSPMLWTSIATGKHGYWHGVHGFTEVDPDSGRVVPVSAATRQARTLWEMLADHGLKSNVVGWFATHGERNPAVNLVSNLYSHATAQEVNEPADWAPPPAGTYWPESLGETLNELRFHPSEVDGSLLKLFVARAAEIDQRKDRRLYHLAERLAEAISVQAAATHLMEHEPWNLTAVYFRAIDEICHEFMPFHPPKMEGVRDEDFELYHDVVNSAYRLHDMFLSRLIALAGKDAAVVLVSDHGFHSDHLRPRYTPNVPAGIMVWHRAQGIFAAAGPGIVARGKVDGARLLDVTPTVLRWFGLPRGQDMEGRSLNELFADETAPAEIPTWEKADPVDTRPRLSATDNQTLLDQFVALGYIENLPAEPTAAAETTRRENNWQLAQAYVDGGRIEDALPLFEDVFTACPERGDYAQRLAHCQMQLGLVEEAEATLGVALEGIADSANLHLIRANIARQRGDFGAAYRHLEAVGTTSRETLSYWEQMGHTLLKLRRWDEAEAAARKVLALDPDHPLAWVVIARCQLHRGENEAAAHSALEAISLQYNNPLAHLNLGLALMQLIRWEEAAHALRNATILAPGLIPPYRLLARALKQLGRDQESIEVMERAKSMRFIYDFQKQQRLDKTRDASRERSALRRAKRQSQREAAALKTAAVKPLDLVIVSGLPRSGTSVMMQMLAAGGLPALTDGHRVADESNPEGYYEWEDIKQLPRNPRLIEQAEGKVVKVISALLGNLPPTHRYKVIFMLRPVPEIVRSQQRMIEINGRSPRAEAAHLEKIQTEHRDAVLAKLRTIKTVDLLEVNYPDMIAAPEVEAARVIEFLGNTHLTDASVEKMAASVNPKLYRQRLCPSTSPE